MHKILWNFERQMDHQILARGPDLVLISKKKTTCHLVDFDVPVEHKVKINESKMIDKYFDHAEELKQMWNMKLTVIPTVVGILGTVLKDLEKRQGELKMRGRIKAINQNNYKSPGDMLKLV